MADATVSNQGQGVTSTTSGHIAQNSAPDVCFTPDKKATIPHGNSVPTARATEHTTDKTQVNNGPVVNQGHAIGPSSDSGDGGACGKGVGSGTCMQEARITTGSTNLHAEGGNVGRKADPTTQNHGNTSGEVKGGSPGGEEKDLEEEKKKACTLKTSTAQCRHKRQPNAKNELEVATPCSVKIVATRINAKVADKPAECAEGGIHTKWKVTKKHDAKIEKEKTFTAMDTLELDRSWFDYTSTSPDLDGESEKNHEGMKKNALNDANAKATSNALLLPGAVAGMAIGLHEVLESWNADKEPIEVEVEGEGCAGTAVYKLKSFPGAKKTFKVDSSIVEKIRAAAAVIEKIIRGAKKICAAGGGKVDGELHLLENTSIEFSVNWAEMTEDKPKLNLYKWNCDREWSLDIKKSSETKKGSFGLFGAKFGISIMVFANIFLPGGGVILVKVISWFGVDVTVGVDLKFTMDVTVGASKKAGEDRPQFTSTIDATFDAYLNLKATIDKSLEASVGVVCNFSPGITARFPTWDMFKMTLTFDPGDVKFGVRGVIRVDTWWYKTEQSIDYYPESLRVSYASFNIIPLAAVK